MITLIAGLPGSGKSHWIADEVARTGSVNFDDFRANSFGNDPRIARSSKLPDLRQAITMGLSALVSDIAFCEAAMRAEMEQLLEQEFPRVPHAWLFFEADAGQCRRNLEDDPEGNSERLGMLKRFAPGYKIPPGAEVLPVWRGKSSAPDS